MKINREAPVVQCKEITINATPDKVWQILSKIENWDSWNERIKKPTLQSPLEVGSGFTWKTNGSLIKSKVHTCIPSTMLGWEGKAFGAKAIHNWYLEATTKGTIVKVEESMEGWAVQLMPKKMNKILANDMEFWLGQLKKESEKQNRIP